MVSQIPLTSICPYLYSIEAVILKVMQDLAQEAISKALVCQWEEAVKINKQILASDPTDVDALNRLARALAEQGDFKKAREIAQKVLKIDVFNTIATKALRKWKNLQNGEAGSSTPTQVQLFLEEPGKTKIVSLLHLGSTKILANLDSGDEVQLNTHSHRVSVNSADGKYVGRLADDLSARLRKLISYGNEYQVFIKSVNNSDVKVFIRETKRSEKLKDISSFSTEKIDYISFTSPELVHKNEESPVITEEDEKEE